MIILIPMGGKGTRFSDQGYALNKALIPVTSRHDGKKYPMSLSALMDIPWCNHKKSKIVCVNSLEHQYNGLEKNSIKFFLKQCLFTIILNLTKHSDVFWPENF